MFDRRSILVAVLLTIVAFRANGLFGDELPEHYTAIVSGSFEGKGILDYPGKSIEMEITVKDKAGKKGKLIVHLPVKNYRFSGKGTILGKRIQIMGRIDLPNGSGPLKSPRVSAIFKSVSGDVGRLVGFAHQGDDDD